MKMMSLFTLKFKSKKFIYWTVIRERKVKELLTSLGLKILQLFLPVSSQKEQIHFHNQDKSDNCHKSRQI